METYFRFLHELEIGKNFWRKAEMESEILDMQIMPKSVESSSVIQLTCQ